MNVNRFAQTPGTEEAAFGIFSQRSGLGGEKNKSDNQIKKEFKNKTNLNSEASSPQTDLSRLIRAIGIITV